MKNKRFLVLAAAVMCIMLVGAVQSSAVTLRYNASEQKWSDLAAQRVPSRSGNDPDNDYYGTNCYAFVDWVLRDEGRGSLSGFCYEAYLNGMDEEHKVTQYLNAHYNGRGPSESEVRSAFAQARAGDVVQMRWSYYSGGSSVHTALVNGFNGSNGVYFFQSHVSGYGVKRISNNYYTYSDLAERFTNPGYRGGFTIYRFEDGYIPSDTNDDDDQIQPKPPINPGLLELNAYSYAKSFTLTSRRYTGVYLDKEFKTLRSGNAWTGENDEDWIVGVGWNNKNIPYARIQYPVGSKRLEAYVKLQEVFVNGTLNDEASTATSSCYNVYARKNSGKNSSYWIDEGDSVWLLTKEDGWCQVMYPISASKYRIAWITENDYNSIVSRIYPEPNMKIRYTFTNGRVGYSYSDWVYIDCSSATLMARMVMDGSTVSVIDGELPLGLTLSRSGLKIYLTGTPAQEGTYTFTIRAKNSYGGYTDQEFTVTIEKDPWPPYIVYSLSSGREGTPYYDFAYVINGTPPFTVSRISGIITPGLGFNISGRYIEFRGTPTRHGTFPFRLRVTDANGLSATKDFTISIAENSSYQRSGVDEEYDTPTKPKIVTSKLAVAVVDNEYSAVLEASGTRPITWTLTDGALPEGMVFGETGEIVGTPLHSGKYKFKVLAENSEGSAKKSYTLKVYPAKPYITTTAIADAEVNELYSFTMQVMGEDVKWSKSGSLPKGLKLNKYTGEIYGTPKKEGTYNFKIKAKNKGGTDIVSFAINVTSGDVEKVSAAIASGTSSRYSLKTAGLYLLSSGQELDDDITINAGTPLTFRAGDADDEEADYSGLKVYMNDEEAQGVKVHTDGTFTIPGDMVKGRFTIYASGAEVETTELEVDASGESENTYHEASSGGCSANLAGIFMLAVSGMILLKKK